VEDRPLRSRPVKVYIRAVSQTLRNETSSPFVDVPLALVVSHCHHTLHNVSGDLEDQCDFAQTHYDIVLRRSLNNIHLHMNEK
jgi:hypothetical protein